LYGYKSETLKLWTNVNNDIYNWGYATELIINRTYKLVDYDKYISFIVEVFGTYSLIGFYMFCFNNEIIISEAYFIITLSVLIGNSVYYLSTNYLYSNKYVSFLFSIGLVTGCIFNYGTYNGFVGQLVFIFILLSSIVSSLKMYSMQAKINIIYIIEDFLPTLLLFLCYQSAIIVYFFVIYILRLIIILHNYFSKEVFINSNLNVYCLIKWVFFKIILNIIIVCTIISILQIDIVLNSFHRIIQSGTPGNFGWILKFFNPVDLVQLPLFRHMFKEPNDSYILVNILFVLIISLLFVYFKKTVNYKLISIKNCKIYYNNIITYYFNSTYLYYLWLILFIIYIILNFYFGPIYIVWKFACYTIVQLSFIPQFLIIFYVLERFYNNFCDFRTKLTNRMLKSLLHNKSLQIILIIIYIITAIPSNKYSNQTSDSFLESLNLYKNEILKADYVIFDIHHHNLFNLAILSYAKYSNKIRNTDNTFISASTFEWAFRYNIKNDLNYIFNSNYLIISDVQYSNELINFVNKPLYQNKNLYCYDKDYISKYGIVLHDGIRLFSYNNIHYYYSISKLLNFYIYKPSNSINRSRLLYFNFKINNDVIDDNIADQQIDIYVNYKLVYSLTLSEYIINNYSIFVNINELQNENNILVTFRLPNAYSICNKNNTCGLPHYDDSKISIVINSIKLFDI
jgi:hypothetical protein